MDARIADPNRFDPARPRIMAHIVAGYPGLELSLAAALALADAGAAYLEVQFPFSDPSADGPVIQTACVASLAAGFKLDAGFEMLRELSGRAKAPVFIMSYASPVVARGTAAFCERAARAGAAGLIIPDLVPGMDEGLYAEGAARSLAVVPLLAPGMREERFKRIVSMKTEFIYAALRRGITGRETEIGRENLALLDRAKEGGAKVMGGFGIRDAAQVRILSGHVHAAIVGTAFTETVALSAPGGSAALVLALRERFASFASPEARP
jgi:tryptophan synthase alpha chain